MRNLILKDFPREVDYITEQPQQFPVRIGAAQRAGLRYRFEPLVSCKLIAFGCATTGPVARIRRESASP